MFFNPIPEVVNARNHISDIGGWWGWLGYDNSGRLCVEYLGDRTRKWLYDGWN